MRRPLAALAAMLAGCGGGEERPVPRDPFRAIEQRNAAAPIEDRAAPRWERVAALRGDGEARGGVRIAADAIQWRARWRCAGAGPFALEVTPPPPRGNPLQRGRCPGRGEAQAAGGDRVAVRARGAGAVTVTVEQQVTTPLREPPLARMRAPGARVVARGRFTRVQRRGRGDALLYRLPGGRLALRLRRFATVANTDLYVWVSPAPRPRTSRAALDAPHVVVAPLKATVGDHNYLLPRGMRAADVRSVVIWCEPLRFAYVAAGLAPA